MYQLIFIVLMTFFPHPLHLAVTEINSNKTTKTYEISHKIFYDDLESDIARQYKVKLLLNTAKENPKTKEYVQKYLASHFSVISNGQLQKLTYIGYEYEEEAMWIYYEMPQTTTNNIFQITDRILIAYHNDQNNFLHFQQEQQRKSLRFNFDNQTQNIEF